VIAAAADSYVTASAPGRNFGGGNNLLVSGSPRMRSYLRFKVPDLEGDIEQATLRVFVKRGTRASVVVRRLDEGETWKEGRVTYRNSPDTGAEVARKSRARGDKWAAFDVTSEVHEQSTVDLALTSPGDPTLVAVSSETRRAPRLVIETTSDPTPTVPPTTPPPSSFPVIAAAGDIACDPANPTFNNGNGTPTQCHQRFTSDLLVGRNLAAVLTLGDNQYEYGSLSQFRGSYDPSWGRVKSITHPTIGNHEYQGPGGAPNGYFDYFGAAAGNRNEGWYSFSVGSWNLIALNSACHAVGGCAVGSPQVDWLTQELQQLGGACTLVYWHHPRFSSGAMGSRAFQDFWRVIYDRNADVVLNAHEHFYERFAPQDPFGNPDEARGLRQFTVGTGGKSLTDFTHVEPNSVFRGKGFGVLEMTLRPGAYSWRFVPEAGGTMTDSGTGVCH
jgi:hypothetical protein